MAAPAARAHPRALRATALASCLALALDAVAYAQGAPPAGGNPLAGRRLWVDPNSKARQQAETWARTRPQDAKLMEQIAAQPTAKWYGGWVRDIRREIDQAVGSITRAGAMPVFVAYNIPGRDCGSYSAGGASGSEAYRLWIRDFARGIAGRAALVILEPDALSQLECLAPAQRQDRLALLRHAVTELKAQRASVYIDAGNAKWRAPAIMAQRLREAGVDLADGFALNVSNVHATAVNVAYGETISKLVGGKHFVIDTSRNGIERSEAREWCNPRGRALGTVPTTSTGHPLIDAYLWVKPPGESDGTCGGGPAAGSWWAEYALELSRAAATLAGTVQ